MTKIHGISEAKSQKALLSLTIFAVFFLLLLKLRTKFDFLQTTLFGVFAELLTIPSILAIIACLFLGIYLIVKNRYKSIKLPLLILVFSFLGIVVLFSMFID